MVECLWRPFDKRAAHRVYRQSWRRCCLFVHSSVVTIPSSAIFAGV
jgi:hypothetical protein